MFREMFLDVVPTLACDCPHSVQILGRTWFQPVRVQTLESQETKEV